MDNIALHDAEPAPAPEAPEAPLLRTILLTDICDSTTLVEQLGDSGTAQFFREHDRLVLRLQQQWRGRLIDRADGLLLLFERPIDGLGFALDYASGLAAIGKLRHLDIRTRAGLHVGEVLCWRNADEAVRLGAKPVEVEGLAKPIAARLVSMARPGQVLMSAVAEPLAHRSARELGERGLTLVWKNWGLWHFKGVPELQQVFEVGEPGLAPLRMPPDSPKAWRRRPLWRRPAVLAAEAAMLVAVVFGGWFATRPPPAIAFNERDWVVVADLRNLTGDARLDDSLEQAFRIALEQSRHVNVLSDLKVRDSLARMRLEPGTVVDRDIASQIAQRDGARAVILPTVSEIGGRLRFSVEVVDPLTQTTVYAQAADGRGEESVLASIDQVTSSVRANLGEAVKQIEHDSKPLPDATTDSIEALRAYALGQQAYGQGRYADALKRFASATELDPDFALAWLGQMRAHYALADLPSAARPLRTAQALRDRLPVKEALYLDAWVAEFDNPSQALDRWIAMAEMYPDHAAALGNASTWLVSGNQFAQAEVYARRFADVPSELMIIAYDDLGRALLGMERHAEAAAAFDRAIEGGLHQSMRRRADVFAVQGRFKEAEQVLEKTRESDPFPYLEKVSIALDQAQWSDARRYAGELKRLAVEGGGFPGRALQMPLATSYLIEGDREDALLLARSVTDSALVTLERPYDANSRDDAGLALSAALLAQRLGDRTLAARVEAGLASRQDLLDISKVHELLTVLRANDARMNGRPEEAIKLLSSLDTVNPQYQTRVAMLEAFAAVADSRKAVEHARWLMTRRGHAYIELGFGQSLQALNVLDSRLAPLRAAEVLLEAGETEAANEFLEQFDRHWPVERLPDHLRKRRDSLRPVSSLGVV